MRPEVEELRGAIDWHPEYRAGWDDMPGEYERAGVVAWGKSRRLGVLRSGPVKAYIGVQHVDTDKRGWNIAEEPHTRFFVSIFVLNRVLTLRTFPTLEPALAFLLMNLTRYLPHESEI